MQLTFNFIACAKIMVHFFAFGKLNFGVLKDKTKAPVDSQDVWAYNQGRLKITMIKEGSCGT